MQRLTVLVIGCLSISTNSLAEEVDAPMMPFGPMPSMADTTYDAAVRVTDGGIIGRNKAARGSIENGVADSLRIASPKPAFNGLLVEGGKSAFTLRRSTIALSGQGKNDFVGIGAGAMARDGATLVISDSSITTSGAVSPALVAAEGAIVRVYDSRLVANGGPLPRDYKPRIGPGMMEPPAPLKLKGDARALLAMSKSRTFLYRTTIEAEGWGALSTDATGGDLYLEANDCTIRVAQAGYGTYADFGAHVVINRGSIESGALIGVIAGKALLEFNGTRGKAARNVLMVHSVLGPDPTETGTARFSNVDFTSEDAAFSIESANADIHVSGGKISSRAGVLLRVERNDDPNATKVRGFQVPGVRLTISDAMLSGDIDDVDAERPTIVILTDKASLTGAIRGAALSLSEGSKWLASADSAVDLVPGTRMGGIDAKVGVTVRIKAADRMMPRGQVQLASGGQAIITD